MTERSSISQGVQIGVEAVPGTAVPADKLLQSLKFEPTIHAETDEFKATGNKAASIVVPNREWSEYKLSGKPVYDEIIYPLAMILGAPVSAVDGTGNTHTFTPNVADEDAVKTLTIEQGSSVRAQRSVYNLLTAFGLTWSRAGLDLSGSVMGQAIEDGAALTAAPTALPLVPILPKQIDIFLDPTSATLGTTKLLRAISGELAIDNRFGGVWTLNSAIDSYAAHVETDPTWTMKLMVEADASGMALLNNLRAGSSAFLRMVATGAVIGAGPTTYKFQLDACVGVNAGTDYSDQDGVYAVEWPLTIKYDATWGKFLEVAVTNTLATL